MTEQEILSLYTKNRFTQNDVEVIESAIENGEIDTNDIFDNFKNWSSQNEGFSLEELNNFQEHYNNLLTHDQNSKNLLTQFN